ncbi:transient receptor potential cation channel subfamily M member 2 isoform X2 [Brachyhypopomus gauderio]|uniref:transient receptor potential cation channel subfamily M member 2 isoform X2 n=1 Tax=Brachyhypopomus gauderio TaxID=698409 RepID=UPI00404119B8
MYTPRKKQRREDPSAEMPRLKNKIRPVNMGTLPSHKLTLVLSNMKNRRLSSWIKENIKKKECCFYVEHGREGFCMCGYPKTDHPEEAITSEKYGGENWNKHKFVREVPTDAFGDIKFRGTGEKTSKYVRVSSETSAEVLYQLMIEYWNLQPPNLLISVTGGAKNFNMKTHLKEKFRRGLIKVAQTTGAWILTGGTHTGVMKHVGMAVRDYTLSSRSMKAQIVAIGMATWGVIHNRQDLVHSEGCFPASYFLDEPHQGRLSCLDNNHSHFLLVDDGMHGHYGAEIELRGKLEKLISEQPLGNTDSGVKIPVVCVVLDGGPGTLNTIYNSMINNTPCVVLEGSGRLADVIAHVAGLPLSEVTIVHIQQLMKNYFRDETFSELQIIEWTKKLQDIVRMPHLLTVFYIDEEKKNDLDVAILQAFLKASRSKDSVDKQNREKQLELAVAWNRVDVAQSEFFTEEGQWKSKDLHHAMFSALVGQKSEFVSLLLENGVCIDQFLESEDTLCELYTHLPRCVFLRKLARRAPGGEKISLRHVSDEVRHLLGSSTKPLYTPTSPSHRTLMSSDGALSTKSKRYPERVWNPERDLFLWSVLQNKRELAEIAWEQCKDSIAAALAASKMLKKLVKEGGDNGEQSMTELAAHFEKHAIGVFNECHRCDEQRAEKLLIRASPSWGGATCLRLALGADNKSFIAHPGVQALLTKVWCGELAVENPYWKVLLSMLFFPLIFTGFVAFRHDEAIRREAEKTVEEKMVLDSVTNIWSGARVKHHISDRSGKRLQPLNYWTRLVSLYSSPQVKFYWNIASYFGFLWLFAVVLMMDFQSSPSWRELLIYVWLTSLVFEEIRQLFFDSDGFQLGRKAKMYIKDLWNILDVLSISLFIIGLTLRLQASDNLFYVGKVILCIDFIIFCLRLMAIFTISRTLGPKIIIVRRMMLDLFFFLFLLSIWVVAYGVSTQGILIQNEQRLDWILRGAVYQPYLIIFGTLQTSIDNTQFNMDSCTVNATDPMKPKCPVLNGDNTPSFPDWLTIIMMCVYLLFANILLLNLLIAIFNYTFQQVQDHTDTFWKLQRYDLIKEYYSRPALPPPFILLSHLYLGIRSLVLCRPPRTRRPFRQEHTQTETDELLSWEAFMKDNYLASLQQKRNESMENHIQVTAEKVDTMSELLNRDQEINYVTMEKRLARLEDQVFESTKALQWIMDALTSQGFKSKQKAPVLLSTKRDTEESGGQKAEVEKTHHFYARQYHYPDSTVKRFPVPEEKVPWEVDFTFYLPPVYSLHGIGDSESSALDKYRNPAGRTGLRGAGALKSLGPNLLIKIIITRCEDSVLQFLAVWDNTTGSWTIPGGPAQPGMPIPGGLEPVLGKKLYQKIKSKIESGTQVKEVYKSYVDDNRNTDNAWMEATITTLHLDWRSVRMDDVGETKRLQWLEVSSQTPVCPYQQEALRHVAELHQVKF